jgi:hypothetical protein
MGTEFPGLFDHMVIPKKLGRPIRAVNLTVLVSVDGTGNPKRC